MLQLPVRLAALLLVPWQQLSRPLRTAVMQGLILLAGLLLGPWQLLPRSLRMGVP